MPTLIAFSGRKGAGKTTAANALVEERGYERLRFAGPMKEMVAVLLRRLGYTEDATQKMVDGPLKESEVGELRCTPRHLLQTIGTEWGRQQVREDLWAVVTLQEARQRMQDGTDVVIDDCRFPNEAEMIREAGGRVVELYRMRTEGSRAEMDTHASEQAIHLVDGDQVIHNNGTIGALRERVLEMEAAI